MCLELGHLLAAPRKRKPSAAGSLPSCCATAVKIPSKFDLPSTAKTLPSKKGKPSTAKKLPLCCVSYRPVQVRQKFRYRTQSAPIIFHCTEERNAKHTDLGTKAAVLQVVQVTGLILRRIISYDIIRALSMNGCKFVICYL